MKWPPLWMIVVAAVAVALAWGAYGMTEFLAVLKRTSTGINNDPPDDATRTRLDHTARVAPHLLAVLREYDPATRITSGYRSPDVNAAVGGSATSRHAAGLAVDFGAGWNGGGTYGAAVHLRANLHRIPAPLRDVLAERNHLHVELIDPLGALDPPGRLASFKFELPNPGDGPRFQVIG